MTAKRCPLCGKAVKVKQSGAFFRHKDNIGEDCDPMPVNFTVEVTRSFSYKMNMELLDSRRKYESRDFFCSQKVTCAEVDAEKVGEQVYQYCKREVLRSVNEYRLEIAEALRLERHEVNERKAELQRKHTEMMKPHTTERTETTDGAH